VIIDPYIFTSAPPDPTTVANLELWLSARLITGYNDGDNLSTWIDSSGNSRDFSDATPFPNHPIYHTSGGANNQPWVAFDGPAGCQMNRANFFGAWTAGKIFMVYKINNDPPLLNSNGGPVVAREWGTDALNNHMPYSDGHIYCDFGSTTRKDAGDPTTDLSAAYFCLEILSKSGQWESRINNASSGNDYFNTGTNTVAWGSDTNVYIGGNTPYFLDGGMEEIIFYSRDLTSGEDSTVRTYLSYWYGIVFN